MARRLHLLVLAALLVSAYSFSQTSAQHPDRIFVNGKIWTEEDSQPQAQALAISGDKIIAVGTNQQIKALAASDTAIIDLQGRLVGDYVAWSVLYEILTVTVDQTLS